MKKFYLITSFLLIDLLLSQLFLLKYINWLALSIDCYIKENYIKNETTLAINMLEE